MGDEELEVNPRSLAVLIILALLLIAAVSLAFTASKLFGGVDSFSESIRTMYESRSETASSRPSYVSGELIVKFRREAPEGEIAGLRLGVKAEEKYVSPFTLARVWRVPPSKTVEELVDFFSRHPLARASESSIKSTHHFNVCLTLGYIKLRLHLPVPTSRVNRNPFSFHVGY